MRVSFRWSRGALATKLRRSPAGWVVRVPAGTKPGTISVRVTDRAGRRSRVIRLVVLPAPVVRAPARRRRPLPAVFRGDGMWIWQLPKSSGGDPPAIGLQARAAGIETVFVKSSDGVTPWAQFSPALVAALHAQGLRVCAWQFVYGNDPAGEAAQGARARRARRRLPRHRRRDALRGQVRPGAAVRRRAAGGDRPRLPGRPDVVPVRRLPPAPAVLGVPRARAPRRPTCRRSTGRRSAGLGRRGEREDPGAHNRLYGAPIAPLGQTYKSPAPADLQRFRQVWASYGVGGLSWWSWQASPQAAWATLAAPAPAPVPLPDPGWPALDTARRATRSSGCSSTSRRSRRRCRSTATFGTATAADARGVPAVARPPADRGDRPRDVAGRAHAPGDPGRLGRARRRRIAEPARRRVAAAYRRA